MEIALIYLEHIIFFLIPMNSSISSMNASASANIENIDKINKNLAALEKASEESKVSNVSEAVVDKKPSKPSKPESKPETPSKPSDDSSDAGWHRQNHRFTGRYCIAQSNQKRHYRASGRTPAGIIFPQIIHSFGFLDGAENPFGTGTVCFVPAVARVSGHDKPVS